MWLRCPDVPEMWSEAVRIIPALVILALSPGAVLGPSAGKALADEDAVEGRGFVDASLDDESGLIGESDG